MGVSARLFRSYACWLEGIELCVCVCGCGWLLLLLARELGILEEGNVVVDDDDDDADDVAVAVCSSSLSPAIIPRDCNNNALSWAISSSETVCTRDGESS